MEIVEAVATYKCIESMRYVNGAIEPDKLSRKHGEKLEFELKIEQWSANQEQITTFQTEHLFN